MISLKELEELQELLCSYKDTKEIDDHMRETFNITSVNKAQVLDYVERLFRYLPKDHHKDLEASLYNICRIYHKRMQLHYLKEIQDHPLADKVFLEHYLNAHKID